jgi:hypothetical protein
VIYARITVLLGAIFLVAANFFPSSADGPSVGQFIWRTGIGIAFIGLLAMVTILEFRNHNEDK